MKAWLARALVRWVGRWWDASYAAWVRRDKGEVPKWWPEPWSRGARVAERIGFPLARRIDSDAMGEQMVDEGWWG